MSRVQPGYLQVVGKTDEADNTVGVRQRMFMFDKRGVKVRALL